MSTFVSDSFFQCVWAAEDGFDCRSWSWQVCAPALVSVAEAGPGKTTKNKTWAYMIGYLVWPTLLDVEPRVLHILHSPGMIWIYLDPLFISSLYPEYSIAMPNSGQLLWAWQSLPQWPTAIPISSWQSASRVVRAAIWMFKDGVDSDLKAIQMPEVISNG